MQVDAPLGFRFRPSDEELVKDYLLKKVRGQQLPCNGIQFCDLYGDKSPWEIFLHGTDHELLEKDHRFYVFTTLKKAGLQRVSRVAGCGTWHGDKKTVKIYADKKNKKGLIGYKKNFTFKLKTGSKKSQWIMHEFSLAGESLMGIHHNSCDFVLCRLKKNGVKQEASFVDNLVNPFVETLNFNPKIGGDFYNNNALAVASSSQQQPQSVSFSCFGEKNQAGYDTIEDFYRPAMEKGIDSLYKSSVAHIPQSEFRLVENSSSILQFNTQEQNLLPGYGQEYYSPITLESEVLKFEFESTTNPDVLIQFNSTEVVDWNNISHMQMDDDLLPLPIYQEGNRMVIEPELPSFESVVEDWSFLNDFQQSIQQSSNSTGTDQVERSCLESNAEDGFVASMVEEYLMKEKEWSNFSIDFGELRPALRRRRRWSSTSSGRRNSQPLTSSSTLRDSSKKMKFNKSIASSSKTHLEEFEREEEETSSVPSSEDEGEIERELAEVTFGDLQKARSDGSHLVYRKDNQEKKTGRANKNRPMEVSAKKPVSRFREVVQAPKRVVRDPRFESLCGQLDVEGFRKRYDFLFENNLPAEKEELKKQLKKTNDPNVVDGLKKRASWIDKQLKLESSAKSSDAAILAQHKKKEKEAAKHGKRPYYLKNSEIRKQKLIEKYNNLKASGKLESFIEKRRKKNASKDHKYMPYRRPADSEQ
ncbi:hypothetical protein LWI28_012061 [Acer negundo]|uniref:NAC domain-containing protein n=1 Tax=Acer negundo TaxID=4023 RepID=A0AAD5IAG0_ACENE|nr:hypothetical protein LWI28_012061 [Acer negundo]